MKVPVFYKNKSLAIRAHQRIQEVLQEEVDVVRAVIQLNKNFNLDRFNRWQTTTDGIPYLLTKRSRFADPRPVFGGLWNYRSTFYKKVDEGRWYIAEIGNKFMDNEEPFGTIPEIAGDLSDADILTVLSKGDEPMDYFGRLMDEGGIEAAMDDEDDGFHGVVQLQPGGELQAGQDLRPEEVQGDQLHQEGGHEIAIPLEAEVEENKVVIGEMELTRYSFKRFNSSQGPKIKEYFFMFFMLFLWFTFVFFMTQKMLFVIFMFFYWFLWFLYGTGNDVWYILVSSICFLFLFYEMFMVVLCLFSSCSVYLDFIFECYGAALDFRCAKRYVCVVYRDHRSTAK